jgi:hypothetical protein
MRSLLALVVISTLSLPICAKNLKQPTEHDYITERYYLGLGSDREIERKMQQARSSRNVEAQVNVICIDIRNYYKNVIALNQANRHFNPKKIDPETKRYQKLLNDLTVTNACP